MISIRPAIPSDLDALLPLFEAQLREHDLAPVESMREAARRVLSNPSAGTILVALAEGRPLGVAYMAAHTSLEHGGIIGWLEELYVTPEGRGNGTGSRLMEAVTTHAKQAGWRGVQLEVVDGQERVNPFYLRHGFEPLPRTLFAQIFPEKNHLQAPTLRNHTMEPESVENASPIPNKEKSWAMAAHLSAYAGNFIPFGNIIAPLVIWLMKRDEMPFVEQQAKEALNAQISFTAYFAIAFALVFVLIGWILLPLLYLADVVLVVIAALAANEGKPYRYPFIFRIVK